MGSICVDKRPQSLNALVARDLWEEGRSWVGSLGIRQQPASTSFWRATDIFQMVYQLFSSDLMAAQS